MSPKWNCSVWRSGVHIHSFAGCIEVTHNTFSLIPQGGHLYFRLILVQGLSKHTLSTYFPVMQIDPRYTFLDAFFLISPSCPFLNLWTWPRTHFSQILHVFAPLNDLWTYVHYLVLKNNPNYMIFFFTRMISNFKYKWFPPPPPFDTQFAYWLQESNVLRLCKSGSFNRGPNTVNARWIRV